MPVPDEYLGVWKRTAFTKPDGFRNTTTKVFWLQTKELFADVRVPIEVFSQPSKGLREIELGNHAYLTKQEAFAGHTVVEGDICQWHREISYLPSDGRPDIGRMTFHSPSELSEDGLTGSYHEDWVRLAEVKGDDTFALRLEAVGQPSRKGLLLGCGQHFMFAADRKVPLPLGTSLSDALSGAASLDKVCSMMAMEVVFGEVDSASGPWKVELSTLPDGAGTALLPSSVSIGMLMEAAQQHKPLQIGADQEQWNLLEVT